MLQEESYRVIRLNYNRLSRWYDSFSASERRANKTGLKLLSVQSGEKVLEIGFGTGHALIELAYAVGHTGSVFGIDLSPGMIAIAHRRARHSGMGKRILMLLGNATLLPFPNNHFQSIFISFTLELFEEAGIPIVLEECLRILQPGGRLGIVSLEKKDTCAVKIYEWFHTRFPTVVDCRPIFIHPLLEDAGFEPTQTVEESIWFLPVEAVVARKP